LGAGGCRFCRGDDGPLRDRPVRTALRAAELDRL
ncbi:MAG: hypothetical protein AVDCRST_MAG59-4224, partial [uncultured Thermomicrobiales bacterium]